MADKLTMKALSAELEKLQERIVELEHELEHKLETTLEKAVDKLKARAEAQRAGQVAMSGGVVNAAEPQRLITETAYLRAERRGFQGGDPEQDWVEAEAEVDQLLMAGWTKAPAAKITKTSAKTTTTRKRTGSKTTSTSR